VHFGIAAARKSFTVCACTAVASSATAHNPAASFFIVDLPVDSSSLARETTRVLLRSAASYVAINAGGNRPNGNIFGWSGGINGGAVGWVERSETHRRFRCGRLR